MHRKIDFDYSAITTADRNPLKRSLQNLRLKHSMRIFASLPVNYNGSVLDYGTGNGELCKRIKEKYQDCRVIGYEPSAGMRKQATSNLAAFHGIKITGNQNELQPGFFDMIFCLEVFEHLPADIVESELKQIKTLVREQGTVILGIPNELYLPALCKGIFRIFRRRGEQDTRIKNILKSVLALPITNRPVESLDGLPYIIRHIGFDYREFYKLVDNHFEIVRTYGSPFTLLPLSLNFEIYLLCRPKV